MFNARIVTTATVITIALALPLVASSAWQGIMTKMLIAALFTTGFNLLLGQAGLLSFGHAAFYGIGAIATLHVMMGIERGSFYLPLPLLPLVGAGAGMVSAFIAGCFATKRSGTYFALVTLAMAELVHVIAPMWQSVFGGEAGLTSMRQPWLGLSFGNATQVYLLTLSWTMLGIGALWFLSRTAFGQLTLALKGNEQRLEFLGFDTYTTKVLTFAISGMIASLAGSLLAISDESANYTLFSTATSTQVIFHTLIGGPALFFGPAIAAAALTAIPYKLSNITHAWPLYQGVLFMVVMLAAPGGLGGLFKDWMASVWDRKDFIKKGKRLLLLFAGVCLLVVFVESVAKLRHLPQTSFLPFDISVVTWLIFSLIVIATAGLLLRKRFHDNLIKKSLSEEHATSVDDRLRSRTNRRVR